MADQGGESTQALKSWWAGFKKTKKKPEPPPPERLVFGVPLPESIKYANVAISLMNERGESFIYGYVPIVVAKCGVFLKEKATDVEGIFRLSGSAKRINELKQVFDSPPKYGKGLDWTGYTVHDAANVFRRYLNLLPQPIVPLEFYEKFRDPLRGLQTQPLGDTAAHAQGMADLDHDKAIMTYQKLITEIPDLNRQLLLYILDLLSVFASKADINRMTSANLAAIFQPGMLSHPDHNLSPPEYRLSQDVILFLIDNQDSFLIGMSGTASDEKTVRDLQNAAAQPGTPGKTGLGRSVSNASAGADSARKLGVRRNISVSSKNSKHSSNVHTPNTPQSGGFASSGVHRSNTVPSKRSPALSSTRGVRGVDSPTASVALSPAMIPLAARHSPTLQPTAASGSPTVVPATPVAEKPTELKEKLHVKEAEDVNEQTDSHLTVETPPNKRRTSGLLNKNTIGDSKDRVTPNKLRKRRGPNETSRSANSSSHSLSNADYIDSLPTPSSKFDTDPVLVTAPRIGDGLEESMGPSTLQASQQPSDQTLKGKSPTGSVHSKSSVTDLSEADHPGAKTEKEEKKRRWRFSSSARKHHGSISDASPHRLGGNINAGKSTGSMASASKSRPSFTYDGAVASVPLEAVSSEITQPSTTSDNSGNKEKEGAEDGEQKKGGIFGRLKARVEKSREERKEKEAEKERAKSPPRSEQNMERSSSKHSLAAIAHDILPSRNRSVDAGVPQQQTLPETPVGLLAPERAAAERLVPIETMANPAPATESVNEAREDAGANMETPAASAVHQEIPSTVNPPVAAGISTETQATDASSLQAADPRHTFDTPISQQPITEEPSINEQQITTPAAQMDTATQPGITGSTELTEHPETSSQPELTEQPETASQPELAERQSPAIATPEVALEDKTLTAEPRNAPLSATSENFGQPEPNTASTPTYTVQHLEPPTVAEHAGNTKNTLPDDRVTSTEPIQTELTELEEKVKPTDPTSTTTPATAAP